jgi:hypothetical protein
MRTAGKRNGIRLSAARYRSKIEQESQLGILAKISNDIHAEWPEGVIVVVGYN